MIRVLLADDEAMVRAGIRAILASDADIVVVAEASDGKQAVQQARRHRPDVILLDIRMPKQDGLTAATDIRAAAPMAQVIMLTTFGEDAYIAQALDAGASGFLLKTSGPHELLAAVRVVAGGGAYLSPEVAKRVISELRYAPRQDLAPAVERVDALTERERQVLALLGEGLTNASIARRLGIVEGTVKGYVSAIFQRLGVDNRVHAALLAYQAGLVTPPDMR